LDSEIVPRGSTCRSKWLRFFSQQGTSGLLSRRSLKASHSSQMIL